MNIWVSIFQFLKPMTERRQRHWKLWANGSTRDTMWLWVMRRHCFRALAYRVCHLQILDGMHLTRQSRSLVANYCRESVYHHLIVEFDCDDHCVEENIKDTAQFYQKLDSTQNWLQIFKDKSLRESSQYEKCSPKEGPLISVNNSENQMIHSVTARGVQGLLQTIILGVLSSPVIKHRVFYFSRVCERRRCVSIWLRDLIPFHSTARRVRV